MLGCGSTQILRSATHLFTAKDKPLVGTIPTYEECAGYAEMMGHPVRAVALDASFKIDLGKFADAVEGRRARLLLQPEQPDGHLRRRARDARLPREGHPRVARHDDPGRRGVLRLRHRSGSRHAHPAGGRESAGHRGAHVLEGVRHGRACAWATRSGTPTPSRRWRDWDGGTGDAARSTSWRCTPALAAIEQDDAFIVAERARNKEVRDFTMKWFADRGMKPTDSQANFMFVNIGRPVTAVPRGVPRQRRPRRARLPAVRGHALPHLVRDDGGDAEGGDGVRRGAREEVARRRSPESA